MAIEFGSAEAQSVLERDRALASDDDGWREDGDELGDGDGVRATVFFNGKELGDLNELVANPTEELKDAFRGLAAGGAVPAWEHDDNMPLNGEPMPAAKVAAGFDYSRIDEGVRDEVRDAARMIHGYGRNVIGGIVAIGKRLEAVKHMLAHGQFTEWVTGEFGMDVRLAQNYMNVARVYDDPQKRDTVTLFSPSVVFMLAAPSTPPEVREQAETRFAETGKPPTRAEVKRLRDETRKPEVTPAKAVYVEPEVVEPTDEPKTLSAHFPADPELRTAKFILHETVQGWRYFWQHPDGERYGPLQQSKADAIESAQRALTDESPTSHPIVHALLTNSHRGPKFGQALVTATVEQLEAAFWAYPADGDPMGKLKIGNRRELLESAQWANSLDTPDPEEAAAIAEVAAEREQEEAERLELNRRGGMLTSAWIVSTLSHDDPAHPYFRSALKGADADDVREAMASLSTEDKFCDARLAALKARLDELEPSPAMVTLTIRRELAEQLRSVAAAFEVSGMLLVDQGELEEALTLALEGSVNHADS